MRANMLRIKEIRQIKHQVKAIEAKCPKVPAWWDKSVMSVDEKNTPKDVMAQLNALIEKAWDVEAKVVPATRRLSAGDLVAYLDDATNTLKDAMVVGQGVYKNDYNDHSDFVRIKNGTHSWYQSRTSIAKK